MSIQSYKQRAYHGLSKTPEYRTWQALFQRCYNQQCKAYAYYGGRGIIVCDQWHEFKNFHFDMGNRPSPNHSIDRIDTNGSYAPDNCRWATRLEQQRNTRVSRSITINEQPMAIGDAALASGLSRHTIAKRVQQGVSPEQALTLPRFHPDASGSKETKTSQYIGVSWDRSRGKWFAFAKRNGRMINLGRFDIESEAALCRDWFHYTHDGDPRMLNFPVEVLAARYPEGYSSAASKDWQATR